jgi:hypothetical protein
MEKTKQMSKKEASKPALRVKSGLSAGASLNACMKNLNYWKNAYTERCGLLK